MKITPVAFMSLEGVKTTQDLMNICEENRREPGTLNVLPLDAATIQKATEHSGVEVVDYAESGMCIDTAMHHLNEAIPNGQVKRIEAALLLLRTGVDGLSNWLALKGVSIPGRPLSESLVGERVPLNTLSKSAQRL